MASLNIHGIQDFIETVLNTFDEDRWVDISLPLQKYHFAAKGFKDKKKPEKGGPRLEWKLQYDYDDNLKDTGLYAIDDLGRKNIVTNGKQEWSHQTTGYTYDLKEQQFKGSRNTIVDHLRMMENGMYNSFFAGMERRMWTAPSSSSLDPMPPSGIPFWIQKTATTGFNGGNPSGWSAGAGSIDATVYENWKNYGGTYSQVSREDLGESLLKAMDYCFFEAPHDFPEIGGGKPNWGLYTVYSVLATARQLLERQNDSLGREWGWGANGNVNVRGNPLIWVPALDNENSEARDTTNPVYGVNWTLFEYFFQENNNMVKHPPKQNAFSHTVYERFMDNSGNFVCKNRREGGFVFYKPAS